MHSVGRLGYIETGAEGKDWDSLTVAEVLESCASSVGFSSWDME